VRGEERSQKTEVGSQEFEGGSFGGGARGRYNVLNEHST